MVRRGRLRRRRPRNDQLSSCNLQTGGVGGPGAYVRAPLSRGSRERRSAPLEPATRERVLIGITPIPRDLAQLLEQFRVRGFVFARAITLLPAVDGRPADAERFGDFVLRDAGGFADASSLGCRRQNSPG